MLIDKRIEGSVGRNAARNTSPATTQKHPFRRAASGTEIPLVENCSELSSVHWRVAAQQPLPDTHFCATCRVCGFIVGSLSSVFSRCSWTSSSQRTCVRWTRARAIGYIARPQFLLFFSSGCNTARVGLGSRNSMCQRKAQLLTRSGLSLVICGAEMQNCSDFRGLHNTTNWKAAYLSGTQLFFASAVVHHSGSGLCIAWCICSANFKSRFGS